MRSESRLNEHLACVVLVCSSSRGGSSITTEFLRQRSDLLHIPAEINPLLHQCELVYPHDNSSDLLESTSGSESQRENLWQLLEEEVGNYLLEPLTQDDWTRFSKMLHKRLTWQWPSLAITESLVHSNVSKVREILRQQYKWNNYFKDKDLFHLLFIKEIRQSHPTIDPRWYDLSEDQITQYFPSLPPLRELPHLCEEPPFVLIAPWKTPNLLDLQTKPLIIKTPSNAYRIPFYRSFFKNQRLKILHLKREGQSSINGLMDGWRYNRGFHSHKISNFHLKKEELPKDTWKYDLPPNFQSHLHSSLADICAFQWFSAHQSILDNRHWADEYFSIWFEEIISHNPNALDELWKWLNVDPLTQIQPIKDMPLEMATCKPREKRWFDKREVIEDVIRQPHLQTLTERLYETNR